MISEVQFFIQQYNLGNTGTPILLACSGGVDSMVLADILLRLGSRIGMAHCNFQLRGDESDQDENFVRRFAEEKSIPFYSTRFDTKGFKSNNDVSTQMAARALRYEWFEKIRKENGYHVIATAHHLDDQLETILLNLVKGTGIKGLSAMQPKNGFIIRPLLEISKQDILLYAGENKIKYREDASNASADYQRNALRLEVIPKLQKINPALHATIKDFISNIRDYEILSEEYIQQLKKKCWSEKNGITEIKTGFINAHPAGRTILFNLISEFNFNSDQASQLYQSIKSKNTTASGRQFFSGTHRIVADRKSFFIVPKNATREDYLVFDKIPSNILFNQYKIKCSIIPVHEANIKASPRFAYFDLEKLQFPWMIRYAKEGDYFYPFGLSKPKTPGKAGKKKLSKYFKDEKFSLIQKENTPVLFSGEKLMWVVGHRIDDRFKVTSSTKQILRFLITKDNA
jgi:tRNA(Ile)-lysidine synthase